MGTSAGLADASAVNSTMRLIELAEDQCRRMGLDGAVIYRTTRAVWTVPHDNGGRRVYPSSLAAKVPVKAEPPKAGKVDVAFVPRWAIAMSRVLAQVSYSAPKLLRGAAGATDRSHLATGRDCWKMLVSGDSRIGVIVPLEDRFKVGAALLASTLMALDGGVRLENPPWKPGETTTGRIPSQVNATVDGSGTAVMVGRGHLQHAMTTHAVAMLMPYDRGLLETIERAKGWTWRPEERTSCPDAVRYELRSAGLEVVTPHSGAPRGAV